MVEILNESGSPDISESFAAYGGRRDPADWSGGIANEAELADITQRGFTAQTHLDASTLVHLGGRVLDTLTGRFLSPDPTVPHPGDTQSFNRYSYLRNDPLSGVDPSGFFDSRFHEDWTFNLHWSRSHRRHAHSPPPSGCQMTSPQGCYGKGGVKAVVDMIVDKVIGPLPSYGWDDSLVLYFVEPDCPLFGRCASDDEDDDSGWGWGDVLETVVDFTPIIGDIKGIYEAIQDPTPVNIVAAVVGLIPGPGGDAAAKGIKAAAKARRALQADVPSGAGDDVIYRLGDSRESATRLGRKSQEAEEALGVHGVSGSTTRPPAGTPCSSASCSALEDAGFPVHRTPSRRDPGHVTIELPNPVTKEVADVFNEVFGR